MATSELPSHITPQMDWDSEDKAHAFADFKERMQMYLNCREIADDRQYNYIVLYLGEEGMKRWKTMSLSDADQKEPKKVWEAFEKTLETSQSFWGYVDELYSDIRQGPTETVDQLGIRICSLVNKAQYKGPDAATRKLEVLYHSVRYFDTKKYARLQKFAELTYEKLLEHAKLVERTVLDYNKHRENRGGALDCPMTDERDLLPKTTKKEERTVDAMKKRAYGKNKSSFQDHRRPRHSQRRCDRCDSQHPSRQCPAFGTTCRTCGKRNHWSNVCRSSEYGPPSEGTDEYDTEDYERSRRGPPRGRSSERQSGRQRPSPRYKQHSVARDYSDEESSDDDFEDVYGYPHRKTFRYIRSTGGSPTPSSQDSDYSDCDSENDDDRFLIFRDEPSPDSREMSQDTPEVTHKVDQVVNLREITDFNACLSDLLPFRATTLSRSDVYEQPTEPVSNTSSLDSSESTATTGCPTEPIEDLGAYAAIPAPSEDLELDLHLSTDSDDPEDEAQAPVQEFEESYGKQFIKKRYR